MAAMMTRHAQDGLLDWIGLRAVRRETIAVVESCHVTLDGLDCDHGRAGRRAVTLIQREHLPVIAALAGLEDVAPDVLRRNLVISGINLAALRKGRVRIGPAVLMVEGACPPCSRMEEYLGKGGYNAVRGHGGWYASVAVPGLITLGDAVTAAD